MDTRAKLSINKDDEATLTGIDYRKLRTILSTASRGAEEWAEKVYSAELEKDSAGARYWREVAEEARSLLRILEATILSGCRD